MYKMLIVDDEIISRMGMSNLLQWEKYGFELTETASNGQQALEALDKYQIDLIITDISMPVMNGIDLIKEVKKKDTEIEFLILSSYEEFDYVREAMRLGVVDYILKLDVSEDSMIKVLDSIKVKLDNRVKKNTEGKGHLSQKELSIMRREFLRKLLYGQLGNFQLAEKYRENVEIEFLYPYTQILMFEMTGLSANVSGDDVIEIVEGILGDYDAAYVCLTGLNEITIVYQIKRIDEGRFEVEELAARIYQLIDQYFNQKVQIFISTILENYLDFVEGYKQVKEICKNYNIINKSGFLFYEDIQKEKVDSQKLICEKMLKNLHHVFENERIEEIPIIIKKIKSIAIDEKYLERNQAKYMLEYILQISKEYFVKNGQWERELEEQWKSYQKEISDINDLEGFVLLLNKLEDEIMTYIEEEGSNHLIRCAQQYIRAHDKENMSIKNMAFELGVSHTYLSSLFKRKKNITIKDYLINLQMEEAKKLLRKSNMQISEIAIAIGYENEHYFSRMFKLKTGISPTKYRNNEKKCN